MRNSKEPQRTPENPDPGDDATILPGHLVSKSAQPQPATTPLTSPEANEPRPVPAIDPAIPATADPAMAPTRIGRYLLLREIAAGGMGIVYHARQENPIKRDVAIKLIKPGMDSREVIARFNAERQALAVMNHPHVARVYDGGLTEQGRPYFVMEYCPGTPITQYCDDVRLDTEGRIDLFCQACEAVHHAHQKGIIHRDLKPSNILVVKIDQKPAVKVIDFGVAKAIGNTTLTEMAYATSLGTMVGTPAYMSPEQAGHSIDIDLLTDVYSLGVVLYELLTGALPLDLESMRGKVYGEVQQLLSGHNRPPAPRPSHRLSMLGPRMSDLANKRGADARSLIRRVSGDLDWVVMKAIDSERTRRYASAAELAADLRRYLAHDPVIARAPTLRYRFSKLVRRQRGLMAGAGCVFLSLILGIVATTSMWVRARRGEEAAQRRFEDVRSLARTFVNDFPGKFERLEGGVPAREAFVTTALSYLSKLAQESDENPALRQELATAYEKVGDVQGGDYAGNLGREQDALTSFKRAEAIYADLAAATPDDPGLRRGRAMLQVKIADATLKLGNIKEAVGGYRAALSAVEPLGQAASATPQQRSDLALVLSRLADALAQTADRAEAVALAERALQIRRGMLQIDPSNPRVRQQLAQSLQRAGDFDLAADRPTEALSRYEEARKLVTSLVTADSHDAELQRDLATVGERIGNVHLALNNDDQALKEFQDLARITRGQAEADPRDAEAQRAYSVALEHLGNVKLRKRAFADALADLQACEQIRKILIERSPGSTQGQRDLAIVHLVMAQTYAALRRTDEAMRCYKTAIAQLSNMAGSDPANMRHRADVGLGLQSLANSLQELGQTAQQRSVLEAARNALDGLPDPVARAALADVHERLGEIAEADGNVAAAGDCFSAAMEIHRPPPGALTVGAGAEHFVRCSRRYAEARLAAARLSLRDPSVAAAMASDAIRALEELQQIARANPGRFRVEGEDLGTSVTRTLEAANEIAGVIRERSRT